MTTNFDILMETVNTYRYSQGFYSRLGRALENADESELESVKNRLNALPQWNDTLDCVFYLET